MGLNGKAVIIDSSVWIAYFDKDDAHHQKSKQLIDSVPPAVLLFTDYVIQEIITIFLYRNQLPLIGELLLTLKRSDIETISVEGFFLKNIIQFIRQYHYQPKISLTDWSLLFLANEFDFNLLTFDKQLTNAHKRLTRQSELVRTFA